MSDKEVKSNKKGVLEWLLDDPTRSVRDIAKEMGTYRQKVWRKKKRYEDEHVIWGYTAVINESKMNYVVYIILMKSKPIDKELADLLIKRLVREEPRKENVRLINLSYVNGEFDWILKFSAPDHPTARKYYDTIRRLYEKWLLEKPVMIDVSFRLAEEGKVNPEIKNLYNFISK